MAETGKASERERDLPAPVMVYYAIALALYMGSSTREVLRCLLEGDSDKQVAARLKMSKHTANGHTKAIFAHFGVSGRAELLARWLRRGWGRRLAWSDE